MKRRDFLKSTALAAVAAAASPPLSLDARGRKQKAHPAPAAELSFRSDGSFTLMQLTDTHYIAGDSRSKRAMDCVCEALEAVRPDLVLHTGDVIFGRPDIESALEILGPVSRSGIPFAVALGNHDSQFGSSREEMFAAIRSLPGCVNTAPKEGVYGCSNDIITLSGPSGAERAFYLFDTMDDVKLPGEEDRHCYDYLRFSQLGWYREWSGRMSAVNGGAPLPSLAFFHIPLRELADGLSSGEGRILAGNNCEPPCPSRVNSGLLAQMLELRDIQAIVTGHDHDCDYVMQYGPMYYIYGRYSGCDTVYNHLGRTGADGEKISGVRIFRFTSGRSTFRTWVRLLGGEIQQELELG